MKRSFVISEICPYPQESPRERGALVPRGLLRVWAEFRILDVHRFYFSKKKKPNISWSREIAGDCGRSLPAVQAFPSVLV